MLQNVYMELYLLIFKKYKKLMDQRKLTDSDCGCCKLNKYKLIIFKINHIINELLPAIRDVNSREI